MGYAESCFVSVNTLHIFHFCVDLVYRVALLVIDVD